MAHAGLHDGEHAGETLQRLQGRKVLVTGGGGESAAPLHCSARRKVGVPLARAVPVWLYASAHA